MSIFHINYQRFIFACLSSSHLLLIPSISPPHLSPVLLYSLLLSLSFSSIFFSVLSLFLFLFLCSPSACLSFPSHSASIPILSLLSLIPFSCSSTFLSFSITHLPSLSISIVSPPSLSSLIPFLYFAWPLSLSLSSSLRLLVTSLFFSKSLNPLYSSSPSYNS